ncbi:MAG: response regulator [Chitinivibrionales bacterium]|nr:response regulator [Chitinivibrionales bacterium]
MGKADEHLILIADDDKSLCTVVSDYLSTCGYTTAVAYDGRQALELYFELKPHLAIIDIRMPEMDGVQFLGEIRKNSSTIPVIITTGYPEVESAIKTLRNGAFDYIVKPLQMELLEQKIEQAFATTELSQENALLNELANLHDITSKLSNTHDLPRLLEDTLECCLDVSKARSGSIQLIDKSNRELFIARQKGVRAPLKRSSLGDAGEWPVSKWVVSNGKALLITDKETYPEVNIPLSRKEIGSSISVPLKVEDETIGVVNLNRPVGEESFTMLHLNTIEVLAAQAGIAINNANLYTSVHQKLDELSLISNYSERLMGLVEKDRIITCLFETIKENFQIDIIGYLTTYKRTYRLMYWSRGLASDSQVNEMCERVVSEYNAVSNALVVSKRVGMVPLNLSGTPDSPLPLSFAFTHIAPIAIEKIDYGILYFAAKNQLESEVEKLSLLCSLVNQTRIALTNAKLYGDMKENYIRTIKALAIAVDAKDTYTHGHSENVMNIAEEIALELALDATIIGIIRDGGLLHDIGKIGVPGYILNKPGSLTYDEFNGVMKTHASLGANIVKDVPFLRDLYKLILYHHENFDGSGYPDGLKGEAIPVGARILHVADAFEAMTSNRPYRNSLGRKEAFRRLKKERGKQFDPLIVDAFFRIALRKGWLEDNE